MAMLKQNKCAISKKIKKNDARRTVIAWLKSVYEYALDILTDVLFVVVFNRLKEKRKIGHAMCKENDGIKTGSMHKCTENVRISRRCAVNDERMNETCVVNDHEVNKTRAMSDEKMNKTCNMNTGRIDHEMNKTRAMSDEKMNKTCNMNTGRIDHEMNKTRAMSDEKMNKTCNMNTGRIARMCARLNRMLCILWYTLKYLTIICYNNIKIANMVPMAVALAKSLVLGRNMWSPSILLHDTTLALTLKSVEVPVFLILCYDSKRITTTYLYYTVTVLLFLLREHVFVNIGLSLLVVQRFVFIVPALFILLYDFMCRYVNRQSIRIRSLLIVAVPLMAYAVSKWMNRKVAEETDKYVMDRAIIKLKNYHGDRLDGIYEIIKVYEEDEEINNEVQERNDEVEKMDKITAEEPTSKKESDVEKKKRTGNGKEAHSASSGGKEEAHSDGLDKQRKDNGNEQPDDENEVLVQTGEQDETQTRIEQQEKTYNNQPDSFIRHNELVRLRHIELSKYISSTTDKFDQKYFKISYTDENEPGFSLWRILNVNKNKEYITARTFLKIKNANTGVMLGIRTDGTVNGSNESRVTRHTFMITECANHLYYKTVQDNDKMLKMANEKTTRSDTVYTFAIDITPDIIDILTVVCLACALLFFYVLHRRYDFYCIFDGNVSLLMILLACTSFLDTLCFKYTLFITMLCLLRQLLVGFTYCFDITWYHK